MMAAFTWEATTKDQYHEMLEILPPIDWQRGAFLVGEPMDSCPTNGRPRYTAYRHQGEAYFVSSRAVTRAELREALR